MPALPESRAAEPADVPALTGLVQALGYPATDAQVAERLAHLQGREAEAVLVLDGDAGCVAFLHVREAVSLSGGIYGEVVGLCVAPEERGRGLGSFLLDEAASWARRRGAKKLRVRSRSERDRAHGFYTERGFLLVKEQAVFELGLFEA